MMEKKTLHFIDIRPIIGTKYPIYAHTGQKEKELLEEHIARCEMYFQHIFREKSLDNIIQRYCKCMDFSEEESTTDYVQFLFAQVVVFHDLGKINPAFQNENMNNLLSQKIYEGLSGREHSFLSSLIYIDYFWKDIEEREDICKKDKEDLKRIVLEYAYIIAHHHVKVGDFYGYLSKLQSDEVRILIDHLAREPLADFQGFSYLSVESLSRYARPTKYRKQRMKMTRQQDITIYFFSRLLYSVLVACDYYATTDYCNGIQKRYFGTLDTIDEFQKSFYESPIMQSIGEYKKHSYQGKEDLSNIHDMNNLRSELFLDAEKEMKKCLRESIYFLEAPTGSGKSNVALNLSFQLMKENGKKLFYIYPFNTLVEQNREILKKSFLNSGLAEKIVVVNSLTPIRGMERKEEDSVDYYQRALLDRQFLNYPIILSTHVSFFDLLFSSKRENLFGFLQLSDAVIVLDEIQSYRNSIWAEIILFLEACADLMGMKIIIMSATLPKLELLAGEDCHVKYLLPESRKYFSHPLFCNRVQISYELLKEDMDFDLLQSHIEARSGKDKKILIEFIKKKTALEFYQKMCEEANLCVPVLCMTGDDSIQERERILKPIREGALQGVILIATQVIEAGVDIDMDIGYKDISKLDSEEQFMGRISRSRKSSGMVYFFDFDEAKQIYADDYRMDPSLTLATEEMQHILSEKNFTPYYYKVLQLLKTNRNESTEEDGLASFFENHVKLLNFSAVEKRMQLIEEDQWSMSIALCRCLEMDDGMQLDGIIIWNEYKDLLQNTSISYAEKMVRLSEIRSQLNYFIYKIKKNPNLSYNDQIGELYCIFDGEQYFNNGKLDRGHLEQDGVLFVE